MFLKSLSIILLFFINQIDCKKVEKVELKPKLGFVGEYSGDLLEGQPHGQGEFYSNQTNPNLGAIRYIGDWKNGKRHGNGTQTWANGLKYVGGFEDDFFNGPAVLTWPDNAAALGMYKKAGKFEGEYKQQTVHGKGKLTEADGTYFEGEYNENGKSVEGVIQYKNGDKYTGEVSNLYVSQGMPDKQGNGKMVYANGDSWQGNWNFDWKEGEGVYQYSNGTQVHGIWEYNQLEKVIEKPVEAEPSNKTLSDSEKILLFSLK